MSSMTVLPIPGHRSSVEDATEWLERSKCDAILLSLPEDLEQFVQGYAQGTVSEDELWNSYQLMTGISRPLVNSLRSRLKPLTIYLSNVPDGRRISLYCYEDLASHVESGRFAEKSLLLSYRARVRHDIDLEEWRKALLEESQVAQSTWQRSIENLFDKATQNRENAVFYEGLIGPLTKQLRELGISVKIAYMSTYWRPPLDVLRVMMRLKGPSELTDDNIRNAVELHMKYLDIVISSDDLDESQKKWANAVSFRRTTKVT